jgi:hypothetical protein
MSKFTIKIELQGLKIEMEGAREDVPRLSQKVGEQIGNLIKPGMLLEAGRSNPAGSNGDNDSATEKRKSRTRKGAGGGRTRSSKEDLAVSIDPATHGSPRQEWNTAQKAIWFLYVVRDTETDGLTASAIANGFNKQFKAAGTIIGGNVSRDLEKERLKGTGATVGANKNEGAAKYFLTEAGIKTAETLIKGEAAAAAG